MPHAYAVLGEEVHMLACVHILCIQSFPWESADYNDTAASVFLRSIKFLGGNGGWNGC